MERRDSIEVNSEPKSVEVSAMADSGRSSDVEQTAEAPPPAPEREYPDTLHLSFATCAFMASFFLVALDVHILATATPKITTEFDSLLDLTWYGGAYLLAQIAVQPSYARLYQVFPIKHVFLSAIGFFEFGSFLAAEAKNSNMLIGGRAVQGTGAGGVFAGVLLMITFSVPKPKRPVYISFVTTTYAVAAVVGPIIGGMFTETKLTWRFCFWMNLPIGFVVCVIVVWAFAEPDRPETKQPIMKKLKTLDPLGASILLAWVTCLLLALQRASIPQPWSYSGIWGPLLAFGILLCIFVLLQFYEGDKAIVPPRILTQRTVAFSSLFAITIIMASTTVVYYLPFYFQSVLSLSPHQSGIHLLPYVVTNSAFAFAAGTVISRTGIYVPFMFFGAAIMCVGGGLLYTLNINSSTGAIVGYQLLASIGFGLCVQVPYTAVQILPEKDIAIGNGLIAFSQGLGSALAISSAQTIFSNTLHVHLADIPNINADAIISFGAVNYVTKVPSYLAGPVREAYDAATSDAFKLTIAGSGIACLASFCVDWRRHYTAKKKEEDAAKETGVTQREVVKVEEK